MSYTASYLVTMGMIGAHIWWHEIFCFFAWLFSFVLNLTNTSLKVDKISSRSMRATFALFLLSSLLSWPVFLEVFNSWIFVFEVLKCIYRFFYVSWVIIWSNDVLIVFFSFVSGPLFKQDKEDFLHLIDLISAIIMVHVGLNGSMYRLTSIVYLFVNPSHV